MSTTDILAGATVPRDFGFSDEHAMLRSEARRFVRTRFDAEALRNYYDHGAPALPATLYAQLAELGWTGLTVSEADGGAGLGMLHLTMVLEELGRGLVPAPIAAGALAARALELLLRSDRLAAHSSGQRLVALALTEDHGRFESDAIRARAKKTDDGWLLTGRFCQVPFGTDAQLLLAPFRLPGHALAFFQIDLTAPGVERVADETMDRTAPTTTIAVDGLRVAKEACCAPNGRDSYNALVTHALLLLAAETLGAAEHALELMRAYAIERQQFGRPIGAFQAVSHTIVDVMIAIENARSLVSYAAAALDNDDRHHATVACRMANVAACDALWEASSRGVQLHGGFGFTWDCDMHFYFRRALYARGAYGDPETLRQQLAAELLD
jgi:alkylation response protein AidB-like acyl-CoA dehydrogenase